LREEGTLRVCQNRVLRKIFGPKRDEETVECGKLHNEELNKLYSLTNVDQTEKNAMSGACNKYEEEDMCIPGFGRET
jgi:hypothetical protein